MPHESARSAALRAAPWVALAVAYAVWAGAFIARSSIETGEGRYFCLFDDAMVSLRYAWNLAHGDGLVWNPGERVEGSTCFLFTLYMALGALFLDKSSAALFVQVTAIPLVLSVAWLARTICRSLDLPAVFGFFAAALVLAYYPLSYWSLMGMETGLLTLLCAAALLVALRRGGEARGSLLLGVLAGLMFATRPDAALPAAGILAYRGAWILHRHRRWRALAPWWIELLPFLATVVALTAFRYVYYGSPLPNTYHLKMGGWPLGPRLENGWKFVQPFLHTSRYLLGLAVGSLALRRDGRRLLSLLFALCVIAGQIWVGGDAWPYFRLLTPGAVMLIVLAVDCLASVVGWLGLGRGSAPLDSAREPAAAGGEPQPARRGVALWRVAAGRRGVLALGFAAAAGLGAVWVADGPFLRELQLKVVPYKVHLNRRSVRVGLELARYVEPPGSVAVMAAGAVPYYSGLRGVDVLGKSDPHVARLPPRGVGGTITPGHNKFDLSYSIGQLRPDVIYDGLAWGRHQPEIFEFVMQSYVPTAGFWFLRGSPHVRWDRLPGSRADSKSACARPAGIGTENPLPPRTLGPAVVRNPG